MNAHAWDRFLRIVFCWLGAAVWTLTLSVAWGDESADVPGSFAATVRPFLTKYCMECHGPGKQKGERRFDTLSSAIDGDDTLVDFQDMLDQLNLGAMPPEEAQQPADEERRAVIEWLTGQLAEFHRQRRATGGHAVLRRLNAREYRNTIRDLLQLNMTMFDPTVSFPRDQTSEHLDNLGSTLVTSGYLLSQYLAAADRAIEKAIYPLERPPVQTWTFRSGFRQQPEIDQVHRRTNEFSHLTLYDVIGADKHEGAYAPIHAFADGVPYDGIYEIRLRAEALNRLHPYSPEFLGTDPSEPLRLGIVAGNRRAGELHKPQPMEPLLAELDLADESKWYTVRIWLDAGFTPRFTFRNGLMDARELWGKLVKRYADQFPKPQRGGIVEVRFNAIKYGKLPQIHIHEVEIEGPLYESWPKPSQSAVFGPDCARLLESGSLAEAELRKHLAAFASRAFRRPARPDEIDRVLKVVATRRSEGRSELEAFGDGLKTILCSPGFLYLEPTGESTSDHALASRLSYFLWASLPDEELLDLAASNRLRDPEVLRSQVNRMLSDPRSDAFVDGFLGSWITLRDLGSTPPDRAKFRSFYHYDLDTAMRRETQLFTRCLIDENLSIVNFLDADFTFVNKRLANHYGLEPPEGNAFDFYRINLPDRRRGGLLGQASVLTVTANGIDTSPVVRGVWLLENILGTPPSPPPPDVEPLDPDIRGATTIRDQLDKHRSVPACYDCHRKIDPLGFALENFDPIGKWRESYENQTAIDPSGELPGGHQFQSIDGLKEILVERKDLFARALTEKLLAYAMGRQIEPADRPHVDKIVGEVRERGYGLRDLIQHVVLSEPFRSQ
jgi:hypothetical protein